MSLLGRHRSQDWLLCSCVQFEGRSCEGSVAEKEAEVGFRSPGMHLKQRPGHSEELSTLEACQLPSRDAKGAIWWVRPASEVRQAGIVVQKIDVQVAM